MKKLEVDKTKCMACGFCYSTDEEHFSPDNDGLSEAISQENLDSQGVANAIEGCPTGAISLTENE